MSAKLACATLYAAVVCSNAAAADPECAVLHFEGEVRDRATYRRVLGADLAFRMEPDEPDWGWRFEIGPANPREGEFDRFIHALNPPYRSRNISDLSIAYGTPAQDAVAKGARAFWFLARREDGPAARQALDAILWPRSATAQEEGISKLATLSMGHGVLRVIAADFDPGTAARGSGDTSPGAYGAIHRIAFSVDLTVPIGFKPAEGLPSTRATCPDASKWICVLGCNPEQAIAPGR